MNEQHASAIDKLRDEMAASANHAGIQEIGTYMTGRLMDRPEDAARVMTEGKSLAGAFEAIRSYARKHKTGDFAYVPPDQALKLVAEYYGLDEYAPQPKTQALADLKPETSGLDLDDLLGNL